MEAKERMNQIVSCYIMIYYDDLLSHHDPIECSHTSLLARDGISVPLYIRVNILHGRYPSGQLVGFSNPYIIYYTYQ